MNIVSVTEGKILGRILRTYKVVIHSYMKYGTLCRLWTEDEYGNYLSGDKSDRTCHEDDDYTYYTPPTTFYVIAHVPFSLEEDKKRGPYHNDICLTIQGTLNDWDFYEASTPC
ncbi:uncharacterized protein OCT59_009934 [Rhizophagus irregularis]|uniref:Uncharacterized protein n=2 Tax=Rhizophagus irregularis TaxID=588596 RepID=A0A916EKR1_9GLOM|nr:hypothetical protein OCT59_009934 [Rhizophagus irregularis]CAB4459757.1 unnamed protein product [Rhizophagus irregularis]CAB5201043.1 unnamed protein product [Rhizophagus irregularis]CAB5395772.1 unnamed protein product [Rhizophagus irregularis]CAG8597773.1 23221_t:CDS:2 [Rhizophagus irregularis]